jgi:type IX secretion system PorP/SprF family membrane protein
MNYKPKAIILGVIFTASALLGQAQQESMYTHYMFNTLSVNPAYAGSRDAFTLTALHRSQWAGFFDKHPITQTLTMHSPTKNENIGLGLSLYNDRLGPEKTSAIYGDFAYRVRLSEASRLSFGLKAGVSMHSIDYLSLSPDLPDDPNLRNNEKSMWLPNFGFGLYYSRERFYTGISIPRILEENYFDNSTIGGAKFAMQRNFYFIAGTLLHLSSDVDLRPTTGEDYQRGSHRTGCECQFHLL